MLPVAGKLLQTHGINNPRNQTRKETRTVFSPTPALSPETMPISDTTRQQQESPTCPALQARSLKKQTLRCQKPRRSRACWDPFFARPSRLEVTLQAFDVHHPLCVQDPSTDSVPYTSRESRAVPMSSHPRDAPAAEMIHVQIWSR